MRVCYVFVLLVVSAAIIALVAGNELHKVEAYAEPYTPAFRVTAFGYEGMFR